MSTAVYVAIVVLVGLLCAALGALLAQLRAQKQLQTLREENAALVSAGEAERRAHQERIQALEAAREKLGETFAALSSQALSRNNEEFLKLARENLKQFHIQAQGDLEKKEKAVETLVKPIKEALEKTERELRLMEKERREAYGSLNKHLETMASAQQLLQTETRNLVQALRRPEVRGQWGEMTLRRLAELAGMVEHCDFTEQTHIKTEDGALRPDMVVRLPGGREIVVDAKNPLDAYLSAVEARDEETRKSALERHARKVRERVKELSAKAYWSQFKNAPDFVVLFIPGDQFLSAALDVDHDLLEDALRNKVILATPTSFVALLRAVAYGWRQEALAENAEQIRLLGEELYGRLATFAEYLDKLGRQLDGAVNQYNRAVGSFGTRVMPGARKFAEMGISTKKSVEEPQPVERLPRTVQNESA